MRRLNEGRVLWMVVLAVACALVASRDAGAQTDGPGIRLQQRPSAGAEAASGILAYGDSEADLVFTPVPPCRIIDTRLAGGPIPAGGTRDFRVTGAGFDAQGGTTGSCGVPFGSTTAAVINFVAVGPAGPGDLRVTAFGTPVPLASFLNYASVALLNIANAVVLGICNPAVSTCPADFTVQADAADVDVVADVMGFFKPLPPAGHAVAKVSIALTNLLDPAFSRNVTAVSNLNTGIYCLTLAPGIDAATPAMVTVEWVGSALTNGSALQALPAQTCTASQIEVRTFDSTGAPTNAIGFVVFVP